MRAHGRCRRCGRTERAHSDLENRRERSFPQRPHASSIEGEEKQTRGRQPALHTKFRTLPPSRLRRHARCSDSSTSPRGAQSDDQPHARETAAGRNSQAPQDGAEASDQHARAAPSTLRRKRAAPTAKSPTTLTKPTSTLREVTKHVDSEAAKHLTKPTSTPAKPLMLHAKPRCTLQQRHQARYSEATGTLPRSRQLPAAKPPSTLNAKASSDELAYEDIRIDTTKCVVDNPPS